MTIIPPVNTKETVKCSRKLRVVYNDNTVKIFYPIDKSFSYGKYTISFRDLGHEGEENVMNFWQFDIKEIPLINIKEFSFPGVTIF
jgi:predicted ATP-dependent protease